MTKSGTPEFNTLKECLEFLQWLHRDRNMQGLVGHRLEKLLQKRYDSVSASRITNELSQFLNHVSMFHEKLCTSPRDSYTGQATAKHVTNALLDCVPRFLTAIYFLRYKVDDGFKALGGGDWAREQVGVVALLASIGPQYVVKAKSSATKIEKYLIAETGETYGGMIPGGFEPGELKGHRGGYSEGSLMAKDLQSICEKHAGKNKHNFFLDVYSTTVLSTSGFDTSNVANALRLVHDFCRIFENVEQKDFGNHLYSKDRCIKLEELKRHCAQLKDPLGKLFNANAFSFTGYAREYDKLKTQDIAKKMASWFKRNLNTVKDKLDKIKAFSGMTFPFRSKDLRKGAGLRQDQSKALDNYFMENLFRYGFTFHGHDFNKWGNRYDVLKEKWDGVIEMLKTTGGGLEKLKQILEGENCPPVKPQDDDEEAREEPDDVELVDGKMVTLPKTVEPPPAKVPEAPMEVVPEKKVAVPKKPEVPPNQGKKAEGAQNQGKKAEGAQNQGKKAEGAQNQGKKAEPTPDQSSAPKVQTTSSSSVPHSDSSTVSGADGARGTSGATGDIGQQGPPGPVPSDIPTSQPQQIVQPQQPVHDPPVSSPPASPPSAPASPAPAGTASDPSSGDRSSSTNPPYQCTDTNFETYTMGSSKYCVSKNSLKPNPKNQEQRNKVWAAQQQEIEKRIRDNLYKKRKDDTTQMLSTQSNQSFHPYGRSHPPYHPAQPAGHHPGHFLPPIQASPVLDGRPPTDYIPGQHWPWLYHDLPYSPISGSPVDDPPNPDDKEMENLYHKELQDKITAGVDNRMDMLKMEAEEKQLIEKDKKYAEYKLQSEIRTQEAIERIKKRNEQKNRAAEKVEETFKDTTEAIWKTQQQQNVEHIVNSVANSDAKNRVQQKLSEQKKKSEQQNISVDPPPSTDSTLPSQPSRPAPGSSSQIFPHQMPTDRPVNQRPQYVSHERDYTQGRESMEAVDHPMISLGGSAVSDFEHDAKQTKMEKRFQDEEILRSWDWQEKQERLFNDLEKHRIKWDAENHKYKENLKYPRIFSTIMGQSISSDNSPIPREYIEPPVSFTVESDNPPFASSSASCTKSTVVAADVDPVAPYPFSEIKTYRMPMDSELIDVFDFSNVDSLDHTRQQMQTTINNSRYMYDHADPLASLEITKPLNHNLENNDYDTAQELDSNNITDVVQTAYIGIDPYADIIDDGLILEKAKLASDPKDTVDLQINVPKRPFQDDSYDLNLDDPPPPLELQPVEPIVPSTTAINFNLKPFDVAPTSSPDGFDPEIIHRPELKMCISSWATQTPTHGSTDTPETELFPAEAPRTVRDMLQWLAGLKNERHHKTLEKCINKAFSGLNDEPSQLALSINHTNILPDHVFDILQLTAMFAGSVLTSIAPNWKAHASSRTMTTKSTTQSDEPDCCALLCQLRDYVYACHYQLQFLKAQCNRGKTHGGWQSHDYGNAVSPSDSPLQAFLTDGWDSTFETHPFDPCNICHKSRVKMGFKKDDLPEKSQLDSVISTILTPSCGG